jgi:hypothetical protein
MGSMIGMASIMIRMASITLVAAGLPLLAGCAGSADGGVGGGDGASLAGMTGDANGGKIPSGVGGATAQSSAYAMVTAHCAKYGKKGFITRMDFETGTMIFECRLQKAKPAA